MYGWIVCHQDQTQARGLRQTKASFKPQCTLREKCRAQAISHLAGSESFTPRSRYFFIETVLGCLFSSANITPDTKQKYCPDSVIQHICTLYCTLAFGHSCEIR